ncbi:hypothetical protein HBI47_221800 [Parastagonospora nodorum]|nr:hypothetical protein HBI47_221800 [Parastagonospora nodorum]
MIIDYETDASGELSEMVIAFRDSGRQDKERHENRLVAFAPKCLNFRNKVLCRCPPRGASYGCKFGSIVKGSDDGHSGCYETQSSSGI